MTRRANPRLSTRFNQLSPSELSLTFLFALVLWTAAGPFLGERWYLFSLVAFFCRGTVEPAPFCSERSFICPRKCCENDGVIICDYAAKQLGGLFQQLPFQAVHLKWVYSGCFPPGRQATSKLNHKERNRKKKTNISFFESHRQREAHRCCYSMAGVKYFSATERGIKSSDSSWSAPANIIALYKWICCSAESIQIQLRLPFWGAKGAENGLSLLIHQFGISEGRDFIMTHWYH